MRSRCQWWLGTLAFGGLLLVLVGSNSAQEKKQGKAGLHQSLRDVINIGARIFNDQGDHAGCYRVYQGALLSVKPYLEPDLQKKIDQSLANAERLPSYADRAFELRRVIDEVRTRVRPEGAGKKKEEKKGEKKEEKKQPTTLWERMGGEKGVTRIVVDAATLIENDQRVDLSRGGKFEIDEKGKAKLVRHLVEYISSITGGPLKYAGPDMRKAHQGMAITNAEYSAASADIKKALEKNKVAPADVASVMQKIESVRKQIVQPKKKPEEKKTETKKETKTETKKETKTETKDGEKKKTEEKKGTAPGGATGQLSGKVMLNGRPLPAGYVVSLASAKGRTFSTLLLADGTFAFKTPLPPGQYRVAIAPPGGEAKGAVALPARYRDAATAGLTIRVASGAQVADLHLVP